jgi:alpha-L-fucosidase
LIVVQPTVIQSLFYFQQTKLNLPLKKLKSLLLSFCFVLALLPCRLNAQIYRADWESLDKRQVPLWYTQAKFGIFIHWGVYAVPGWSPKGDYAEWYQQGLQTNDTARQAFQKKKFGDRNYYDLVKDFKAELYDPNEWARLIERSGAKYVVLTSKHHEGFALWPSKESEKTWGFPWNAATAGPHRDLLGELFTALRKTSVRPGLYYSLYEWFNPVFKNDKAAYVNNYMLPQMTDLINTYKPDVLWTDGDWDMPAEKWKSQQFLAWLYNDSPVKNTIVTYDRWGSGIRFHHGGVYTPEYQPDLDFEDHPWEESRGMGYSYGYNRAEDAWDYNSAQSLVISLIDKVSRGGNFLLDIGPDAHGKIPPIMQERLLQIGDWLNVNGEAIYNTVRWKTPSQWSEGNRDYKPKKLPDDWKTTNDYMLKLTVDPEPGYAVKEVFYTYSPTENNLYAIMPKYPSSNKLVLKDITLGSTVKASLLDTKVTLNWKQEGKDAVITLPAYDPNVMKTPYAYVVRLAGYGAFLPKPQIAVQQNNKTLQTTINLTGPQGAVIHYTLDGRTPNVNSMVYSKPFTVKTTTEVKAVATGDGILDSKIAGTAAAVYTWNKAITVAVKPGIAFEYIEPTGKINMLSADQGEAKTRGIAVDISVAKKERAEKFAFRFSGYVKVAEDGIYTFSLESDDGSKLSVDGQSIAVNDGGKGAPQGGIALKKGLHKINLSYYDSGGDNHLSVYIAKYGGEKTLIPSSVLFH